MNHISPIILKNQVESKLIYCLTLGLQTNDKHAIKNKQVYDNDTREINKRFTITVQPKNACKLEFVNHFWPPFLDQPKSDIVVFAINNFQIFNILVSKCKH